MVCVLGDELPLEVLAVVSCVVDGVDGVDVVVVAVVVLCEPAGLAFGVMATGVVGSISVRLQPAAARTSGASDTRRSFFIRISFEDA